MKACRILDGKTSDTTKLWAVVKTTWIRHSYDAQTPRFIFQNLYKSAQSYLLRRLLSPILAHGVRTLEYKSEMCWIVYNLCTYCVYLFVSALRAGNAQSGFSAVDRMELARFTKRGGGLVIILINVFFMLKMELEKNRAASDSVRSWLAFTTIWSRTDYSLKHDA